jgi:hypothetical protein
LNLGETCFSQQNVLDAMRDEGCLHVLAPQLSTVLLGVKIKTEPCKWPNLMAPRANEASS